jgi:hypothetical protein
MEMVEKVAIETVLVIVIAALVNLPRADTLGRRKKL